MGVNWTVWGLTTQYPIKTEAHNEITDNKRAKTLAALTELRGLAMVSTELPKEMSKGTQSQLTE